jgi:predicted MFS family arabinose efflux permease
MRTPLALAASLLSSALVLAACSPDQQAPTAPSTTPSFFQAHKTETFSLSCTNAGSSTFWHVTASLNSASFQFDIFCGGTFGPVSMTSYGYLAHLFNSGNTEVAQCTNTRPIKGPKSITCQDAARSGASSTLSVN